MITCGAWREKDLQLVSVGVRTWRKQDKQLGLAQKMEQKKQIKKGWDSFLPFYSQWYWSRDWLNEKYKVWYHGPRIKWMNLVKEKKKK